MIGDWYYCLPGHEVHQKPFFACYRTFYGDLVWIPVHKSADAYNAFTYTARTL